MAVETKYFNDTAHAILGEILNTLNGMPYEPKPWIGQPPFLDTKTNILYEIWMTLSGNGSSGNGLGGQRNQSIYFEATQTGLQPVYLPAKCLITSILIDVPNSLNGQSVSLGIQGNTDLLIDAAFTKAPEANMYSFNPTVFIGGIEQVVLTAATLSPTNKIRVLIYYTDASSTGF